MITCPFMSMLGIRVKKLRSKFIIQGRNGNFAFQEGTWKNRLLKQRQKKLLFFSEIIS